MIAYRVTNSRRPSAPPEDDFWRFSLDVYQRPLVAQACLKLQDRHGADVNLLLYCCWVAHRYAYTLDHAELDMLIAAVTDWQDTVTKPLRGVRRRLKTLQDTVPSATANHVHRLRQALQQSELDAEHQTQRLLVAALVPANNSRMCYNVTRAAAAARWWPSAT